LEPMTLVKRKPTGAIWLRGKYVRKVDRTRKMTVITMSVKKHMGLPFLIVMPSIEWNIRGFSSPSKTVHLLLLEAWENYKLADRQHIFKMIRPHAYLINIGTS
jgi:hypothetical protein